VESSTNEQLAITFYPYFVPSGKFYKRTSDKPFSSLCQVASSTNEKLANPFLFCVKWKFLQTNSLQTPFTFITFQVAGSPYKQLANTFNFHLKCHPLSGQEMSLINHSMWQVLQMNSLQLPFIFIICQVASSTNEQPTNPSHLCVKWQVQQMKSLQTPFIFHHLCQVASSTNEQLANTFYPSLCAKRQVLQTNSLHLSFISPSVIPSVSGHEMSLNMFLFTNAIYTNSRTGSLSFLVHLQLFIPTAINTDSR